MEGRRGHDSNLSGARLPRRSAHADYNPKLLICHNCGERAGVMDFELIRHGKRAGHWQLCEPCWRWVNAPDPRDADPLQAA